MQSFITEVINVLFTLGQISLDLVILITVNVTLTLNATIAWIAILAGLLYDSEALLEKGITLLTG